MAFYLEGGQLHSMIDDQCYRIPTSNKIIGFDASNFSFDAEGNIYYRDMLVQATNGVPIKQIRQYSESTLFVLYIDGNVFAYKIKWPYTRPTSSGRTFIIGNVVELNLHSIKRIFEGERCLFLYVLTNAGKIGLVKITLDTDDFIVRETRLPAMMEPRKGLCRSEGLSTEAMNFRITTFYISRYCWVLVDQLNRVWSSVSSSEFYCQSVKFSDTIVAIRQIANGISILLANGELYYTQAEIHNHDWDWQQAELNYSVMQVSRVAIQ